jgi:site-specific DNA-methyltransferase (adenine-specific)
MLRDMDPENVDAIVTDPPYELGFMSKRWDASGIAYDVSIWCEMLRVIKSGGYLLAFGGTRTFHRMTCAIEDAGFEIRDSLSWIYSEGMPKSKAGLKPAFEPITLARKNAKHVQPFSIDACRIRTADKLVRPSISRQDNKVFGKGLGAGVQIEPTGRWPSNIVIDEDVADLLADRAKFFYCAKASKKEREGNIHPTVKPIALMRWLVRLITPPSGVVLDPFAGSGTTGVACVLEGFDFLGFDLVPEHVEIANRRIAECNTAAS